MKLLLLGLIVVILLGLLWTVWMPGKPHKGPLPALTPEHEQLSLALRAHVQTLAEEIGPRSTEHYQNLLEAERYIENTFITLGYQPNKQSYTVFGNRLKVSNIEVQIPGTTKPDEILVIGAHYDSVGHGIPGANDNASGVAALLELSRTARDWNPKRTVKFVAFVNEEPPFFMTNTMGSYVYANSLKAENANVMGMISLETIGYYSDKPVSQVYPPLFSALYPSTGNFIGFVSNMSSGRFLRKVLGLFRANVEFPAYGVSAPAAIEGIGWSDQWSFWEHSYPALMVTDTAPFRYPDYHRSSDTPDKLNYEHMARVVHGLELVIREILGTA